MGRKFTEKKMNDIICYWMEAVHVSNRLHVLAEYKDEATIMSLGDAIEDALGKAENIKKDAENKLKGVIQSAIAAGSSEFGKYSAVDAQDKLDNLMDILYDHFDDIYGYSEKEQINNFYGLLCNSLDELLAA